MIQTPRTDFVEDRITEHSADTEMLVSHAQTLEQEVALANERIKRLERYARHKLSCEWWKRGLPCNCGLTALLNPKPSTIPPLSKPVEAANDEADSLRSREKCIGENMPVNYLDCPKPTE